MNDDVMVSMIVGIVLCAVLIGFVIFEIVWIKRIRKKYLYRWQGHEIVFEIAARSVRLYVDGNVEDELGAQNIRVCTLRSLADGAEIKARMAIKGMRVQLDVSAGGTPLQLIGVGK